MSVDGSPFVFEADEPNAFFILPVAAGEAFSLSFIDPQTGDVVGTAGDLAPASGEIDIGAPLTIETGALRVTAEPNESSLVDIVDPLVLSFSEAVDLRTIHDATVVVTGPNGSQVPGTFDAAVERKRIRFLPARRWRYGATYRYGVATQVKYVPGGLDRAEKSRAQSQVYGRHDHRDLRLSQAAFREDRSAVLLQLR